LGAGKFSVLARCHSGEFTTFGSEITAPLAYNATAEQVGALNTLETIQNAGGASDRTRGRAWEIRFNESGNRDNITATPVGSFDGNLECSTALEGIDDIYETQQIFSTGTQGSFSLSFEGEKTAPLAYNASAADLADALNALEAIKNAGGVTVEGGNGSPWKITFSEPGNREQITCRAEAADGD
jgi:hypothetical protein